MPSTIFSGSDVKTLKDNLSLNDKAKVIPSNGSPAAGSGVAAPLGSLALDYTNGKIYKKIAAGDTQWQELGSGIGGINYITNTDAESGTTGWSTYADTSPAGPQPVDGTGGSPNVTWTRSTTTPLRGTADFNFVKDAANRQGQGVSTDITIDLADEAKILTVTFDYEILSGTYATGDLTVYLIQDPAGTPVVIQPAGYQVQAATAGTKMRQIATFQTAATGQSYRVCFHVASTSASAYTLALDNIVCGPQVVQYGAPVTDWTAYTPAAYVGLGTPTGVSIFYRRNGDSIDLMGQFTTGTVSGTANSISLPAGLSIATGKGADSVKTVGRWYRDTASASTNKSGTVQIKGTESVFSFGSDSFTVAISPFNESVNGSAIFNSTEAVMFEAQGIPIQGWSSTVQMSNDTDTRVVAAKYSNTVGQSLTANVTNISFSTKDWDTHGAFNGTTFTAPISGYYQITGAIRYSTSSVNSVSAYVDGVQVVRLSIYLTTAFNSLSGIVYLNSGQALTFRSDGSLTTAGPAADHWVSVSRVSGPSAIAASETVAARYTTVAGQSIPNTAVNTVVDYGTKDYDTHGAVTTGAAWKFTAPVSGKYRINMATSYANLSWSAGNAAYCGVNKNGVAVANLDDPTIFASVTDVIPLQGSATLDLVAGDTIQIYFANNRSAGAATLITSAAQNYVEIVRVGN